MNCRSANAAGGACIRLTCSSRGCLAGSAADPASACRWAAAAVASMDFQCRSSSDTDATSPAIANAARCSPHSSDRVRDSRTYAKLMHTESNVLTCGQHNSSGNRVHS